MSEPMEALTAFTRSTSLYGYIICDALRVGGSLLNFLLRFDLTGAPDRDWGVRTRASAAPNTLPLCLIGKLKNISKPTFLYIFL